MNMNDDYLWDQTGEPDADLEQLEELLGRFRHQGKAPELPQASGRFFWSRLAVAAALIVMLFAGFWILLNRQASVKPDEQAAAKQAEQTKDQENKQAADDSNKRADQPKSEEKTTASPQQQRPVIANRNRAERRKELAVGRRVKETQDPASMMAVVDFETANYFESAQMLLRSFRNIASEDSNQSFDLSYEKERSRDLLYRNIVLRRDSEARGNLPITDLLGTLEPILLDIANLPADSSQADVRSIQERIQKKEIVATLQVYSAPVMGMALRQR